MQLPIQDALTQVFNRACGVSPLADRPAPLKDDGPQVAIGWIGFTADPQVPAMYTVGHNTATWPLGTLVNLVLLEQGIPSLPDGELTQMIESADGAGRSLDLLGQKVALLIVAKLIAMQGGDRIGRDRFVSSLTSFMNSQLRSANQAYAVIDEPAEDRRSLGAKLMSLARELQAGGHLSDQQPQVVVNAYLAVRSLGSDLRAALELLIVLAEGTDVSGIRRLGKSDASLLMSAALGAGSPLAVMSLASGVGSLVSPTGAMACRTQLTRSGLPAGVLVWHAPVEGPRQAHLKAGDVAAMFAELTGTGLWN